MIDNQKDLSKFHRIYERYKNTMYAVAYNITKNSYDAEDIVEVSLLKVIGVLHRIRPEDIEKPGCKNLMITITKNTAIDLRRKEARIPVAREQIEYAGWGKSAEELYIEKEDYRLLLQCIRELDERYRDVLRLRALCRLSARETAAILNTNEININTQFMRAKRRLAQKMEEHRGNGHP